MWCYAGNPVDLDDTNWRITPVHTNAKDSLNPEALHLHVQYLTRRPLRSAHLDDAASRLARGAAARPQGPQSARPVRGALLVRVGAGPIYPPGPGSDPGRMSPGPAGTRAGEGPVVPDTRSRISGFMAVFPG